MKILENTILYLVVFPQTKTLLGSLCKEGQAEVKVKAAVVIFYSPKKQTVSLYHAPRHTTKLCSSGKV